MYFYFEVNLLTLTPVTGASIIENRDKLADYDFSNLWIVGIGGAKLYPEQLMEYLKIFPKSALVVGYGMTETAGVLLNYHRQSVEELQDTKDVCIGTPVQGCTYKVMIKN